MNAHATISVIIPAKDEEKTLPRVLESLAEQTLRPREIIVAVSPDTTDKTAEIAREHGARVVEGGMPSQGRNAGAAVAKGELLCFLDADVTCGTADFLQRASEEMDARGLDLAVPDNKPLQASLRNALFFTIFNATVRTGALLRQNYACGTCILARKSAHEAIGGFHPDILFFEDTEYTQRGGRMGYRYGVLSRKAFIRADARRLDKDGTLRTIMRAVQAETRRKLRGEHQELDTIDPEYFSHARTRR